jgi:PhnB protein
MVSDKHIPLGFPALVPYFTVDEPDKFIAFLKGALGAEEMKDQRWEHPAGEVIHSALRVEGCVVETGRASAEWPAMPLAIHLYVRDVDATYKRALKAGGVSLHEPREMEYDERACAVRDPSGNNWYIATHTGRS